LLRAFKVVLSTIDYTWNAIIYFKPHNWREIDQLEEAVVSRPQGQALQLV